MMLLFMKIFVRCVLLLESKLTPRTKEVKEMTGYVTHDPVLFKEALTEFKELACKEFNFDETHTKCDEDPLSW